MEGFTTTALATFLLSLRFIPVLAFSPPFTLLRVPTLVRVLFGVSVAFWMVSSFPELSADRIDISAGMLGTAFAELFLGLTLALALQWAFAAIYVVGRSLDIQAGFGLALLADPTTQAQIPLMGTVFAYGAAAVFFAIGGAGDLLAIFVESLIRIPMGSASLFANPAPLLAFIGTAFVVALGLVGIVILVLFMIDLTVAFLSRTLPQMNVLLIGFQVKTLAILATLPLALSLSLATYLRLIREALQTSLIMIPG